MAFLNYYEYIIVKTHEFQMTIDDIRQKGYVCAYQSSLLTKAMPNIVNSSLI